MSAAAVFSDARGQAKIAIGALSAIVAGWFCFPTMVVPIGLAGAPLALAMAIFIPHIVVIAFVGFSLFRIHEAYPFLQPLQIPIALGMLALASLAWHIFLSRTVRPFWTTELKYLAGFFCWFLAATLFAQIPADSLDLLSGSFWKIVAMTFAVAWLIRARKHLELAMRTFLLCGIAVASVAVFNSINGLNMVEGGRVMIGTISGSGLGDPNDLALVLLFPLSFAISAMLRRPSALDATLGFAALPLLLWAIAATKSRGGLLGVVAVVAVLVFSSKKYRWLGLGLAILLGAAMFAWMGLSARPYAMNSGDTIDDSAMFRLYAWKGALNMLVAHPIFGVGPNNFKSMLWSYTEHWVGFRDLVAHSTWLTVFSETGLLGGILFINMIWAAWRTNRHTITIIESSRSNPIDGTMAHALSAGIVGYCAAGTFLTQSYNWQIYMTVGLCAALSNIVATQGRAEMPAVKRTELVVRAA